MKSIAFFLFLLFISSLKGFSQNLRVLHSFDSIPLGSPKFEIEGFMAKFSDFSNSTKSSELYNENHENYTWLRYAAPDSSSILLSFRKGILYLKRLVVPYSIQQMDICKSEVNNLRSYVVGRYKIVSSDKGEITSKIYGVTGYTYGYYLTNSSKSFKYISIEFDSILKINYDWNTSKSSATIIGYESRYEFVDLSKTDLNSNTGFQAPEN